MVLNDDTKCIDILLILSALNCVHAQIMISLNNYYVNRV